MGNLRSHSDVVTIDNLFVIYWVSEYIKTHLRSYLAVDRGA